MQRFQRVVPAVSISSHLEAAAGLEPLGNEAMCFSSSLRRIPGVLDDATAGS